MRSQLLACATVVIALGAAPGVALGAFPGAAGRIAFDDSAVAGGPGEPPVNVGDEIFSANPDGSGLLRLTTNDVTVSDVQPAWSPNGRWIAFASNSSGTYQISTMAADGRYVHQVTWGDPATAPAWSPDGCHLVYVKDGDLWIVGTDGGWPHDITNTPLVDEAAPTWSPLGTSIAYTATTGGGPGRIFAIRPDGTRMRDLSDVSPPAPYEEDLQHDYSPHGKLFLFASTRTRPDGAYGPGVWVMHANGSRPAMLIAPDYHVSSSSPRFSPTGKQFVLSACGFGICYGPIFDFHRATMTASPIPVGAVNGASDDPLLQNPSWQPT
jgi:Tol biopolymer transport system component